MLKRSLRQAWICPRCTYRQQTRGFGALAAATEASPPPPPVYHRASNTKNDDQNLRNIFDRPAVWKEFSTSQSRSLDGRRAGLLQNRYLTSPEGFKEFSSQALAKCKGIVSKALAAQTTEEYSTLTRDLDRLSDQLCRVIDLVDFIRNVHPDPKIQQAASQAHMIMYEYMKVDVAVVTSRELPCIFHSSKPGDMPRDLRSSLRNPTLLSLYVGSVGCALGESAWARVRYIA